VAGGWHRAGRASMTRLALLGGMVALLLGLACDLLEG
jgi:hypothetical protein